MRVSLLNPPPFQRVDQYDTPDFTRLGLTSLAGWVRAKNAARVQIVDAKFERLSYAEVVERVRAFAPDVIGITAFTNEVRPAARLARQLRAALPGVRLVLGGVHVSALPAESMVEFPEFDIGVIGEGEETLGELLAALDGGRSLNGVRGIIFRDGDALVRTAERPRIADQDSIPRPARDLVPRSPRYLFMTQRGCPYACTFCMNPNGRTVRTRSLDHVMDELTELMDRYAPRELYMCDEIFTANPERAHRLLDAMIAAGVGRRVRWEAQVHVNTVSRDLFAKMRAAGCYVCGLGIETGDEDIMRAMQKGITRSRVVAARKMAAEAGLPVQSLMIIGHPGETVASAMKSINFAAELNPERPIFGVMVPYPGTHVAELARRGEGGYKLLSRDWNDYNKQIGHALAFENLSRRQLEMLQALAYVRVFTANGRFLDLARFAWQYRSEGWAVLNKIVRKKRPSVVEDFSDEPPRDSPYFDGRHVDVVSHEPPKLVELARRSR